MLKNLIFSTLLIYLLIICPTANAYSPNEMQTVDSQKTWTIHFNSEIKLDDLSKQAISIHDSNGNLVKTTFNLSNDKKSILIFCPREGYHQGEKYELNLTNKIHSEKGHFLKHPFSFKFKIKEDTPYINDEEIKNLIIDADANLYNVLFDRHLVECLPKSIEGYEYMPLHKFNTYEKLFNHINKCFSRNETDRIINTNYFLNSYNRLSAGCGDPGLNLDVATSKVITTSKTNNKITFDLCGYLDDGSYYPVSNSYTLVLENNHWLIDKNTHWDYSEFPYRDNRNKQLADNSSSFNLNSYFKDPNIEKAIRKQLNKPKEPLSQNDLNTIYYLDLKNKNIRNIDGLENLHNLTYLNLSYNPINNFNSLKNLVNLEYLNLNYTCIHDLKSLDHLTNLSDLYINYSDITDITPLKNLKNLINLEMSYNEIIDINPISSLKNLVNIDMSHNKIEDIQVLRNISKLYNLNLSYNQISDICSLKNLINLESLDISNNTIYNIDPLKNLINLQSLDISNNTIYNVDSLKNLINLEELNISNNTIYNIDSLKNLTMLTALSLSGNNITDLAPIKSYYYNLNRLDFNL